ncbi:MAG: nucleotidyltransferase family protein [Deltaproteobacteria bacterium]
MARRVLLLAAGKSTRIHAVTKGGPKPLLEIDGDPIIFRNLRWLASQGYEEIFVNLHYKADLIREAVGDGSKFGVSITYSVEDEILGTAGAVKNLAAELGGDTFVVVYGDNLLFTDLAQFEKFHFDKGGDVSIALFDRNTHPHTGIAGGRVVIDDEARVVRFAEGASDEVSPLVNAGVYFVEPSVLDAIPANTFYDFGKEVFPDLLERARPLYGHSITGYCLGIDTPETFERANALISAGKVKLQ